MRASLAFSPPQWRQRRSVTIFLTLASTVLLLFAAPTGSISAAIPVSRLELTNRGAVEHAQALFDGDGVVHRQLLIKRHEQISSGSVASGFVHPTHLYRRDADALPTPNKAYNLTVTQGNISPDGFERLGFLMNGKFPADPFVWDENDDIEITVNNESPVPFAIHWHGIHQIGSPEMDGVPGLSQWNIYTGESYTYRFKLVNQYGGYWYHSHERGYYADGLRGTICIRPRADRKKPWSLISSNQGDVDQMEAAEKDFQVMQLSDHWHINHTDMLLVVHETGVPPACFDSLHINGRGRQYCVNDWSTVISPVQASLLQNFSTTNPDGITSKGCISLVPPKTGYTVKNTLDTRYGGVCQNTTAPLTVFSAAKAISEGRKWLNLQIIDTATNWYYGVSIDSHKMWIVAVDGHYIEPIHVDWAQITIGSRLSVMVELDTELDGYVFPIRLTGARALQPIEGHAFLSYIDDVDGTWTPTLEEDFGYAMRELTTAHVPMSGFITDASVVKWQQNLSTPFDPISKVPQTSNMTLHAVASQNSLNVWQLATMPLDTAHLADERPMLFNATDGNATSNQMTPYASIPVGTVVDIIMENNIYSIVGGPNSPHPFHMHSRRFWIIGSGSGPFPADTVAEAQDLGYTFNLDTPPLRDGFDIDSNSWVVIRYIVDHAAANILHCHIDDHAIEGMAAVLLEGLETIPAGGNFSESIKARPAKWVETQNDELGQVLEAAWATGSANAKYELPAVTETVTPWGDPRALANSIQLVASSNSVQESITSSLQSELSLMQATATEEVTAITATVLSDHLTTFTGVPASTDVVAAAVATAVATVTASVPVETAVAIDTAQSTLLAAAYTTKTAAFSAVPTQTTVPATQLATVFVTVIESQVATAPATVLVTAPISASAAAPALVSSTASLASLAVIASVAIAPAAISTSTLVAAPTATSLATAPAVVPVTSSAVVPIVQPISSSLINTAVATAPSPASLIAYSTLFRTSSSAVSAIAVSTSTAQLKSVAQPVETEVATATQTAAAPESSSADTTDPDQAADAQTTSGLDNEAAEETEVATSTPVTVKTTEPGTERATNLAAITTKAASSTHVYSALGTQQVVSVAAATSLNRAASTPLQTTQMVIQPSKTSSLVPAATQSVFTTTFVTVSQTQLVSTPATQLAASLPNSVDVGTHSATATFVVDSTAARLSSAVPAAPSATSSASEIVDEPAYDDPVFPSATSSAPSTATQRVDAGSSVVSHATTPEPSSVTVGAVAPSDTATATAADDEQDETYQSE